MAANGKRIQNWLFGAEQIEFKPLLEHLESLEVTRENLTRIRELYPEELTKTEIAYTAGQRCYDPIIRDSVMRSMELVTSEVAWSISGTTGQVSRSDQIAFRIEEEVRIAQRHLRDDGAIAVTRGLNSGLLLGLFLSPLVISIILLLGRLVSNLSCADSNALFQLMMCIGGGAAGAALSVVVRVRGGYQVMQELEQQGDGTSEHRSIPPIPRVMVKIMRREGFYRVALGWLLATSLFLLVGGRTINVIQPPTDFYDCMTHGENYPETAAWLFYGGLGFLAGLNERWAYGLLQREKEGE